MEIRGTTEVQNEVKILKKEEVKVPESTKESTGIPKKNDTIELSSNTEPKQQVQAKSLEKSDEAVMAEKPASLVEEEQKVDAKPGKKPGEQVREFVEKMKAEKESAEQPKPKLKTGGEQVTSLYDKAVEAYRGQSGL